jgi:hypothetical protein
MEKSEEKKEIVENVNHNQETEINQSDKDAPRTTLLLDNKNENKNETETKPSCVFAFLGYQDTINIILAIVFGYFSTRTSNILYKVSFVVVFMLTIYIVKKMGIGHPRTPPNSVSDDNGRNLIEG